MLRTLAKTSVSGVATRSVRGKGFTSARSVVRAQLNRGEQETAEPSPLEAKVLGTAGLLAPLLFAAPALAKDGELGLLEGRTFALVHPFFMGILFLTTLYAGFSGYQWRRARDIQEEVKTLKAQLPKADDSGAVAAAPAGLQSQISALEQERKDILASGPRDKHWAAGSWLLGAGVLISVEGAVNTYIRTGKLFPGPHLYAGAIITVLWALAAALVPAMQKGDENARRAHIALNVTSSLMFISQIPTGLEIVDKVFQFTQWP